MVKSNNKIKMQLPEDGMTITEVENWLTDMAGQGMILEKMELMQVTFTEDEPQNIKYRIIPNKGDMDVFRLKEINEQGYFRAAPSYDRCYVDFTLYGIPYYVFKCTDTQNGERLQGDELNEKYLLKAYRRVRNKNIWGFVGSIVLIGLAYLNYNPSDTYEIYEIMVSIYTFALACISPMVFFFGLLKVHEKKDEILNYEHQQMRLWAVNQNKSSAYKKIMIALYLLIAISGFIYFSGKYFDSEVQNLDGKENVISLVDIEGSHEFLMETDGDYEDCFTGVYKSTFIVPIHYNIDNDFNALDKLDYNVDIKYEITYDKLRVTGITDIAYKGWVEDWKNQLYSKNDYIYISSEYFDNIVYYYFDGFGSSEDDNKRLYLCLSNNKEFITITYEGKETAEEIIHTIDKLYSKQ